MAADPKGTTEAETSENLLVHFDAIEAARERIRDSIHVTPCHKSENLSSQLGCQVFLKLDNLQRTGSFKERGAANKLMTMPEEERRRGVIASSAGNHAQAVAYHGTKLGIDTKIVMPEGTPLVKVTRTKRFGGKVVLHGANYDAAYAHAMELAEKEGRAFVHPFDDPAIIAGQGTLGLEVLEQNPYLDVVLVPIGGGGLVSGIAAALKQTNPKIRVIGVEPEVLPSMQEAVKKTFPFEMPAAQTLADGVAVRKVGKITHANVSKYVDEIVTVDEEEIANAILVCLEEEKFVVEGAGAAPVAALLAGKVDNIQGKRVCSVVSGGNIDVNVISRIIERGLVAAGRLFRLDLQIEDVPGSLADVLSVLADERANVLQVFHNRTFMEASPFGATNVELTLETRGAEHIEQIRTALEKHGYKIIDKL
ncbi:threonine ammonia-lyase [Persicimonas caeni]|uniref:threonine ammonia-lyase n=1 Tax=Persicimonas caeni TaxID=2292766 RepID=A0A4Y6PPU8_PERCE|nr:threonine ammonia-lyase [Persicimonas caeni]QDG50027.1 threonine ammonia-lyase [Persicimonas caeni]QED31248.1 threonine ammonia-lyase [Persicimonas caeni]